MVLLVVVMCGWCYVAGAAWLVLWGCSPDLALGLALVGGLRRGRGAGVVIVPGDAGWGSVVLIVLLPTPLLPLLPLLVVRIGVPPRRVLVGVLLRKTLR